MTTITLSKIPNKFLISFFILFFILINLIAPLKVSAQDNDPVLTIKYEQTPLNVVVKKLATESKMNFTYDNEVLSRIRIDKIEFQKTKLSVILNFIKDKTGLTVTKLQNNVVIGVKPANNQKKSSAELIKQVTGIVYDTTGVGLVGTSVRVKNTAVVTTTNTDGKFTIACEEGGILVFSQIGFITQEIPVNSPNIKVTLKEDNNDLNEVVVVGYGKQRKISLTGSVASIQTKDLKQSAVSNLSNALVGRLPGLIARQNTDAPGNDGSYIWLRGKSTFSGSTSPLIMVDGVPREGFEVIDPNEVESITILKDVSATAIYGVRGANGVILVTTRRGTDTGKPKVQINLEQAVKTPIALPEFLNSSEYFKLYRQGLVNDGLNTEAAKYTDEYISRYDQSQNWPESNEYKYLYPDVNWVKDLLKPASYRTSLNANISGGNKKIKYFVSGSYLHQNGIYDKTDDFESYNTQSLENRFNFRSNIDMELSSWLTAELNISTIVRNQIMPDIYQNDFFTLLKRTPSYVMPMLNPDGSIAQVKGYKNPYGELVARGYQKPSDFYLQGTAGLTAKLDFLLKGLSARTRFSYDAFSSSGYYRDRTYSTFTYQGKGVYQIFQKGQEFLNYALYHQDFTGSTSPEFYLNYNRQFQKHSFSGMLLYLLNSKNLRSSNAIGALPYRQQGLTGRFTYNYDSRYFAEFDFGYNGSENFIQGRRFGFFPAVSAAWVINKEAFLRDVNWLELLKIRFSAGKVGNQDAGTRFAYQSTWNLNSNGYNFGQNYENNKQGAVESTTGNPFVTWETSKKYNLGLDVSLRNGLLAFSGDLFYEDRTGIYSSSAAITSGLLGLVTFPKLNEGIVHNKGFEFEISHRNSINQNLNYQLKGTYTFARNKIIRYLEIPRPDRPWQQKTGTNINEFYGLVADGLFQSNDEISKAPSQSVFGVVQPGDIRYKDINGDGVINDYDKTYLGKLTEPEQIIGLSANVSYKSFDITALFQGAVGRWLYTGGSEMFGADGDFSQLLSDWKDNYWNADRPNATYPRLMSKKNINNTQYSTFWMKKADYLRLKNVEIGYSLPKNLVKKAGLSNVRVYVNGNNLYTWTGLRIFDPEEDNSSPNYPLTRTFNGGISLTF